MNRRIGSTLVVVTLAIACSNLLTAQDAPKSGAPPSVDALIAAGLKDAATTHRTVFVEFGASWCAPCKRLQAFLDLPAVRPIMDRHFTQVRLTVWERGRQAVLNNPGGDQLIKKWGGRAIPFYAFLRPDGAPALDSTNVGFPESNTEIGAFLDLLAKAAPALTPAERTTMAGHLATETPAMGWNVIALQRVSTEGQFTFRPTVSADGRVLAFADFGGAGVSLRDLAKSTMRQFGLPASAKDGDDEDVWDQPVLSRDGKSVAVSYVHWNTNRRDLRVFSTDATSISDKPLFADPGVEWIRPHQWTADGRWIVVELARKDSEEIGMVSTSDGTLKVLKRLKRGTFSEDGNWTGPTDTNLLLSPDERYLVYDVYGGGETGETKDIAVLRLSDGAELPGIVHAADDSTFGWAPDGGTLFFTSNRTGAWGVWAAPYKDGGFGDPVLVRPEIGEITTIGVLPDGSLLYAPQVRRPQDVWGFQLDFASGTLLSPPSELVSDFVGRNSAASWSADGSELLFTSARPGRRVLLARKTATGETREIGRRLDNELPLAQRIWAPDGRSFAAMAGTSVYTVDARSGEAVELIKNARALRTWSPDGRILFERQVPATGAEPQVAIVEHDIAKSQEREVFRGRQGGAARLVTSPDGRSLYYRHPVPVGTPPHDLVARDLKTGAETVLVSQRTLGAVLLSPDGKLLVTVSNDAATKTSQMLLISTTAGTAVRTLRVDDGPAPTFVAFAPDSRSLLATRTIKGSIEYWWVPFDDRQPKRVPLPSRAMQGLQVSSDGKSVAFVRTTPVLNAGVWTMTFERRAGAK